MTEAVKKAYKKPEMELKWPKKKKKKKKKKKRKPLTERHESNVQDIQKVEF